MSLSEIFGASLLTKEGLKSTEEALTGKTAVGVYFSAHWCPPCRGFTPKLAQMYNDAFKGKGMEIVFVSSDRDQSSFDSYYSEQPWLALPYDQRDLKEKLSKKYKVQGIPTFVILGPDGNLINRDGRDAVSNDPTGEKYPWAPPTKEEKAKMVLDALGDLVGKTNGKPIGVYFSAHWCPPCRGFTPELVKYYNEGLKDKMEIIFVSSDKDQGQFDEYFAEMPWLALPYEKRKEKNILSDALGVQGIPQFSILNSDGTVLTNEGRSKVSSDPKGETFPAGWLPQPFNNVNDDPSDLNSEKCVVALGSDAAMAAAVKAVAEEKFAEAGKDVSAMALRFFSAPDGNVTQQLKNLTKQYGNKLVVLDIPDDGGFYVCEGPCGSVDDVKAFLASIDSKMVPRQQLQK